MRLDVERFGMVMECENGSTVWKCGTNHKKFSLHLTKNMVHLGYKKPTGWFCFGKRCSLLYSRTKQSTVLRGAECRGFNDNAGGKCTYRFWVGKGCQSEQHCCRVVCVCVGSTVCVCGKFRVVISTRLSLMLAPACRKSKQMSADMFCNFSHFTVYVSYVILHTKQTHTHTHSIDSVWLRERRRAVSSCHVLPMF
jgi:hypothetical protein